MPLFLYHNHNHFQQNTIAPVGIGTEGFSELFKNRLVIPVRYSHYDMTHLLAHEYTHIGQFEILYGGFWRSPRLTKGLAGIVPLWIMEGQAEHVSHNILNRDWSSYDKMILRDAVLYDYLYSILELQNFNALYRNIYLGYKQGHSAFDYLVEVEGEEINFKLLKSLRKNIDPYKAFEEACSKFSGLRDFDIKWQKHVKRKTEEFIASRNKASDSGKAIIEDNFNSKNAVSDGKGGYFYVTDRWIQNEIYHTKDGKDKNIIPSFFGSKMERIVEGKRYDRIIDFNKKTSNIVFLTVRNHKHYLCFYDIEKRNLKKHEIKNINEPRSPSFSPDGKSVIFTALKGGRRNIFKYDIISNKFIQVTHDNYFDYSPVFSANGSKIITATERKMSTDLRKITIQTGKYEWLTQTGHFIIHPISDQNGNIYYSADKEDVFNIYIYDGENHKRITNLKGGAFYPVTDKNGQVAASCFYEGSYKIVALNEKGVTKIKETEITEYYKENNGYEERFNVPEFSVDKRNYAFDFSTDFFLPSFLYSTDVGFMGGGYYKGSDMLGIHDINLYGWAWPGSYDVFFGYMLQKWRSNLFLQASASSEEFYRIIDRERHLHKETENTALIGLQYPFDSYHSLSLMAVGSEKKRENKKTGKKIRENETGAGIQLTRDTTLLEPFQALRGASLRLGAYAARPVDKHGLDFNRYDIYYRRYIPVTRRAAWANRIYTGRYEREDRKDFRLNRTRAGSPYRLRGYERDSFSGQNVFSLNSELRVLALDKIDWHIFFMWPDINLYSLSVSVFADTATAWHDDSHPQTIQDWGISYGAGIRLNMFLLQQSPVYLNFEFATPYSDDKVRSYITFNVGHVPW